MKRPRRWIKPLAKAGYSARGLVYAIVGLFAVLAAFGAGEKKDSQGALQTILHQPFGTVLVWLMVVGLAGYVLWRLIQSLLDTDDYGLDVKGVAVRAGLMVSAFTYGALAVYALSLLGVTSGGSGGGGQGPVAETLAGIVGARWVALGLSIIFAGVAIAHWWKAATQKYERHFDASDKEMVFINPVSMVGLAARGFVLAVISVLLFYRFTSAGTANGDIPGLKDALQFVQHLPFGQWLLVALGLGLIFFAAYSFAEARWRRINMENAT